MILRAYGTKGWGFELLMARQKRTKQKALSFFGGKQPIEERELGRKLPGGNLFVLGEAKNVERIKTNETQRCCVCRVSADGERAPHGAPKSSTKKPQSTKSTRFSRDSNLFLNSSSSVSCPIVVTSNLRLIIQQQYSKIRDNCQD